MVNMKDVSRHAGVSVATVSNVITGKRPVSQKIHNRVMSSIRKLDYQVNYIARGLKTQRTSTIGVVLPGMTQLFFQKVLNGIISTASKSGYRVMVMNSNYDFETERALVYSLASNFVDGIILDSCVPISESWKWAAAMSKSDGRMPPVVSIESKLNPALLSSVSFDNALYSYQMTQHLIRSGRRRILFVSGPIVLEHERARYDGYLRCLEDHQISLKKKLVAFGDFLSESGYHLVRQKLRENIDFDAVQASSDQAAIGALKALREAGIRIPDQVSVCGFDNVFPSTLVSPAVTTVDMPGHDLGCAAVEMLIRLISSPDIGPLLHVLDARLLIRESSVVGARSTWDLEGW